MSFSVAATVVAICLDSCKTVGNVRVTVVFTLGCFFNSCIFCAYHSFVCNFGGGGVGGEDVGYRTGESLVAVCQRFGKGGEFSVSFLSLRAFYAVVGCKGCIVVFISYSAESGLDCALDKADLAGLGAHVVDSALACFESFEGVLLSFYEVFGVGIGESESVADFFLEFIGAFECEIAERGCD